MSYHSSQRSSRPSAFLVSGGKGAQLRSYFLFALAVTFTAAMALGLVP